jgi:hypothetical protein
MGASFGRNAGKALVGAKIADFAAVPVFVAAGLTTSPASRPSPLPGDWTRARRLR